MLHYTSCKLLLLLLLIFQEIFCYSNRYICKIKINLFSEIDNNNNNNNNIPLINALINFQSNDIEQFFFPGHTSGKYIPNSIKLLTNKPNSIFHYDLPELDGLDNIHSPEGPLLRTLENASKLFNSKKTWFSVNGSTLGILVAILTVVQVQKIRLYKKTSTIPKRGILLIGRDSHKSVFDGIRLADCDAVLLPCIYNNDFGINLTIDEKYIAQAIEKYGDQICGLLFTRPSYQGVAFNTETTKRIIELCHTNHIPVIIDEAHGSHLKFINYNHLSDGLSCSADIVIQSTHKTLLALSQCAMIHLNNDAFRYDEEISNTVEDIIHEHFSALTTTSPNAMLLASLESCVDHLTSNFGINQINDAVNSAVELKNKLLERKSDSSIRLLEDIKELTTYNLAVDPLRLSVRFDGQDAIQVDNQMCEDDNIYCELNLPKSITYAISIGSTNSSLTKLEESLINHSTTCNNFSIVTHDNKDIDKDFASSNELSYLSLANLNFMRLYKVILSINNVDDIVNKIAAETICVYPPGIPIMIRGEKITIELVYKLLRLQSFITSNSLGSGCSVTGCVDKTLDTIQLFQF